MADFATQVALKLAEEISRLARGQKKMTPRSLLKRFGYARRGPQIVAAVNEALSRGGVVCAPPLGEAEGLDDMIVLTRALTVNEVEVEIEATPDAAMATSQSAPMTHNATNPQSNSPLDTTFPASGSAESSTRFDDSSDAECAPVAAMSAVAETVTFAKDNADAALAENLTPDETAFSAPKTEAVSPITRAADFLDSAPLLPASPTLPASAVAARPVLTPQQMLSYAQAATVLICTSDGHGSGFVVDRGGLIATARHVIGREEKVQVFFHDDTQVEGRVLASNATLDYAFLRVPPCKIGFRLRGETEAYAGQRVFAVGSPRDRKLAGSVTAGVISNTHRVEGGVEYLQTDTSISPGNSGGPLIAEDGTVIGMNVWGRTDGAGLNFALPAAYFASALDALRPQLGALDKCVYCADCGFLNAPDRWIECRTWICCGNCGTQLGELSKES